MTASEGTAVPAVNRVVVLRHAKATHKPGFRDIERPLTRRGEQDAAAAGRLLRQREIVPDLVLCSPSLRTRQTWDRLAEAAGQAMAATEVSYDPGIYGADAGELTEIIRSTAPGVATLLVVGHNPAVAELVADLTGADAVEFPTAALAVIELAGGWPQAGVAGGRLTTLWTPKD